METKLYMGNILCNKWFLFQIEIVKKCYWKCQLRPNKHIKIHPTSCQYPLINYLDFKVSLTWIISLQNIHSNAMFAMPILKITPSYKCTLLQLMKKRHFSNVTFAGWKQDISVPLVSRPQRFQTWKLKDLSRYLLPHL